MLADPIPAARELHARRFERFLPLRVPQYRPGAACPGCGGSHWDVRRSTAECQWCGEVLPL